MSCNFLAGRPAVHGTLVSHTNLVCLINFRQGLSFFLCSPVPHHKLNTCSLILFLTTTLLIWVYNSPVLEYVGCYKDSDPRDLPQRVHEREITVRSCAKSCKNLFYRYAGLQFSYLCFCGNKRGRYGQLPEWKCSSECTNKKDKHCGGYWSNSIYKTGALKISNVDRHLAFFNLCFSEGFQNTWRHVLFKVN